MLQDCMCVWVSVLDNTYTILWKMPKIVHSFLYGFHHMSEIKKTIFKMMKSVKCCKWRNDTKLQYIIYPLNIESTIAHMHNAVLHYLSKCALITNEKWILLNHNATWQNISYYNSTFLAVFQIIYLSIEVHKMAKERQRRLSISGEMIRKIVLNRKAICTLISSFMPLMFWRKQCKWTEQKTNHPSAFDKFYCHFICDIVRYLKGNTSVINLSKISTVITIKTGSEGKI